MSAVCPACGVPVVPGYVRCPKCHAPLPRVRFRRAGQTIDPGGTAVEGAGRMSIVIVIAVGVACIAIVAYLGLRGGKTAKPAVEQAVPEHDVGPAVVGAPRVTTAPGRAGSAAAVPDARSLGADLERSLKKQRLWATVEVIGDHVDVRSGSCGDPAMSGALDAVAGSLKIAGVSKLRCLEQSGHVVFSREL